jgi:hypothetical protein
MAFCPSRRFLGLPVWTWLLLPSLMVLLAYLLGRPADLSEPGERAELFRPIILVAREGDSFHFVSWEEQQNVTPLWALTCRTIANSKIVWSMGWGSKMVFGFWKRSGSWRYDLEAVRFDTSRKSDEPPWLAADNLKHLRPLVIDELNGRSPNEHRGDRLAQLLDHGIERRSDICVQNAVILLAWLSLPIALLSFIAMFIRSREPAA